MAASTSVKSESEERNSCVEKPSVEQRPASPSKTLREVFDSTGAEKPPVKSRPEWNTLCLATLTVLAIMYTLYFARPVLIPVSMSLVLASLLHPLVLLSRRMGIPDALSTGVLLGGLLLVVTLGIGTLIDPAMGWINKAPEHIENARMKLDSVKEKMKVIDEASRQIDKITIVDTADSNQATEASSVASSESHNTERSSWFFPLPDPEPDRTRENSLDSDTPSSEEPVLVEVRQPRLITGLSFLSSTGTLLAEVFVTFVLAYFFLSSGNVLLNNILHTLPRLSEKRHLVELVGGIGRGLSAYLFTITVVNLVLGLVVACVMWMFGMPNPLLWGAMATCFNFVPYLGALAGVAVLSVVSVLTYDSLSFALVPPLVYWGITLLEGSLITPQLIGRSMSLNPIFVFASLLFWGWMWGVGGALLAVPLLAVLKICLDQFEHTQPLGTLMGERTVRSSAA